MVSRVRTAELRSAVSKPEPAAVRVYADRIALQRLSAYEHDEQSTHS